MSPLSSSPSNDEAIVFCRCSLVSAILGDGTYLFGLDCSPKFKCMISELSTFDGEEVDECLEL